MSGPEPPIVERSQRWATFAKASDFLLLTEPIWVSAAVGLVYVSVIFDWASFFPWLMLAIAFAPFPLRQIRLGYLSQRTPFDIPIIVFLVAIIVGISVSDHLGISLGAFQTFLAMAASYYFLINYPEPSRLMKWGLPSAVVGLVIASVFAARWAFYGIHVPNGLAIGLVIIAAIALGMAIFGRRTIPRVVSGLLCSSFLGLTIFFTSHTGALRGFFTLESIVGRLELWQNILNSIGGSSIGTGLGLGCWPLAIGTFPAQPWLLQAHNAYLELYLDTGVFGIVALICFVAVIAKLAVDIIYSSREHPYYGFGIGVLLAILAVAVVSFLESAPFGFGILSTGGASYDYVLSPIPWILAALLVIARRLLRQPAAELSSSNEKLETVFP
jgi:hypothetical protein